MWNDCAICLSSNSGRRRASSRGTCSRRTLEMRVYSADLNVTSLAFSNHKCNRLPLVVIITTTSLTSMPASSRKRPRIMALAPYVMALAEDSLTAIRLYVVSKLSRGLMARYEGRSRPGCCPVSAVH
jgi:hypothetical protein